MSVSEDFCAVIVKLSDTYTEILYDLHLGTAQTGLCIYGVPPDRGVHYNAKKRVTSQRQGYIQAVASV